MRVEEEERGEEESPTTITTFSEDEEEEEEEEEAGRPNGNKEDPSRDILFLKLVGRRVRLSEEEEKEEPLATSLALEAA